MLQIGLIALLSYLAGSIPTSVLVGKLFFGKDPRNFGSGNAGGTNAFRTFGWRGGVPTVLVDVGKGVLATLLISRLPAPESFPAELVKIIAGCCAVIGHVYTVFAGFRGGKGVGTAAGMVASLYPLALAACLPIFGLTLLAGGYVSVASLTAALAFPFVLLAMDAAGIQDVSPVLMWFSIPVVGLIFFTHRSNIRRLIQGKENRFPKLMVFARLLRRIRGRRAEEPGSEPGTPRGREGSPEDSAGAPKSS